MVNNPNKQNKMKTIYLAMDIGGTFIKYALVSPGKRFLTPTRTAPVNSMASAKKILESFHNVIVQSEAVVKTRGFHLRKICVAICGPFDYENGVSLMQEDKYRSIYNLSLKDEFRAALTSADEINISFIHDVQAFLLGQSFVTTPLRNGRVLAVTLGTGVGTAFMENGRIIPPGRGIPDKGLGRLPYRSGKIEDYIGGKALVDLYRKYSAGSSTHSVKEIAELARRKDSAALRVFHELGDVLGETLASLLNDFSPERLVFGGQISKAYDLFREPFLARVSPWIGEDNIIRANDLETATLLGAVIASENNGKETNANNF